MQFKKNLSILFFLSLILFNTPEKSFAKIKQQKHAPSRTQIQNKKAGSSRYSKKVKRPLSSKEKIVQKNKKKETNKVEAYSTKTIKNFTINVPSSWQCIDDSTQLPENVAAVFISNKNNGGSLTTTINITLEVTQLNQEQYVFEALKYHNSQEGNLQSYIFDTITTPSGTAYILRSERLTQFGEVIFIQSIIINKYKAYVITGSSTKEQFGFLFPTFLKAVSSFTVQDSTLENNWSSLSHTEE